MNGISRPKGTRYHSLDFWRGVACLMVILFHSSYYMTDVKSSGLAASAAYHFIAWMRFGVTIFFVISGYCITAACDSPSIRKGIAAQFFFRRYRRIFPPYWVVFFGWCLVMLAVSLAGFPRFYSDDIHPMASPRLLSFDQWIGNVSLTETWRPLIWGSHENFVLGHAWTLCYEEQFYLICGLALLFARKRFFPTLAAVTIAVIVLMAVQGIQPQFSLEGLFADGHWLIFAAGVWVYYRIHCLEKRCAIWADAGLASLLCLVVWLRWFSGDQMFGHIAVGIGFAWLLILLHAVDVTFAAHPVLRPVTLCGTMCYSFYLIHWPITKTITHVLALQGWNTPGITFLVTAPLCVVVSVAAAWIFHVLVERKFLNTPPTLVKMASTPAAGVADGIGNPIIATVDINFFKNLCRSANQP